jgi:hypothetical protein
LGLPRGNPIQKLQNKVKAKNLCQKNSRIARQSAIFLPQIFLPYSFLCNVRADGYLGDLSLLAGC